MKRTLFLITLAASVNNIHAAVGDTVTGNGNYVAEGVVCSNFGTGYLQVNKTDSTRLYNSTKKAEWVSGSGDSNIAGCMLRQTPSSIGKATTEFSPSRKQAITMTTAVTLGKTMQKNRFPTEE